MTQFAARAGFDFPPQPAIRRRKVRLTFFQSSTLTPASRGCLPRPVLSQRVHRGQVESIWSHLSP